MKIREFLAVLGVTIVSAAQATGADYVNTSWTPSGSVSASGSGTLNAIAITIGTAAVANGGITNSQDWDAITFVNNAGFTNVAPVGGIDLGYNANTTTTQTIGFGGSGITNPYYLINFLDNNSTFTFAQTPTYFSGSQATIAGNVVTSTGDNTANAGFIVGFTGTFTSLNFDVARTGALDSVAFTVVVPVPEPSTYVLSFLATGLIGWSARLRKNRKN